MSSNINQCPEGKKVYLENSNQKNTFYICLVEDQSMNKDILKKKIEEEIVRRGLSKNAICLNPEIIVEGIADFLTKLQNAIIESIKIVHPYTGLLDISLPRVSEEKINPGEFSGNFVIFDSSRCRVILHVQPKVGWDGYIRMLEETRQSIDVLVSKTGIIEPFLGNLYYPSLSSPISYSILLLRLTEMILFSSPPKKTISVQVVSEGIIGRPVLYKTIKYILQGYSLGVYERIKIEPHDYPFMLLAKFHYELSIRLGEILGILEDLTGDSKYYWLLGERINILRNLHLHYLTTPPLLNVFNILIKEEISDQELLEQTRRSARTNPYFNLLADLYEMYRSNIGLLHEYVERGEIIPSASCKIYELWILTRIINFLEERYRLSPSVEEYEDLYIKFRLGEVSLAYNMPQQGFFLQKLSSYNVLSKRAYLRPDFILYRGDEVVVYDAKYKTKISPRDIVTLLAYIAEYAYPINVNNEKELRGALYKLAVDPKHYKKIPRVVKNDKLPIKIAIYLYTLDPRMPKDEIDATLDQSLQPLLVRN